MKQLLIMFMFLCSSTIFAQDVIVKKDGSTVVCRVISVNETEIVYKKWGNLNGANFIMDKSLASAINYENGKKVSISEVSSLYKPYNQNDGSQKYNDRALLGIDSYDRIATKAKQLKKWGWTSGIAGLGLGAVLVKIATNKEHDKDRVTYGIVGGVVAAGGLTAATLCFINANKYKRKLENRIQSSVIYQHTLISGNDSELSASIDMLHNHIDGNKTLGIGLHYNF